MKRIMVTCLIMALLATMTIGVSATTITPGEYTATADKFTVEIEVGTENNGKMFGFVAVPTGAAIEEANIVYIDQATAADGKIVFTDFAPKGAAPSEAGWKNCDLYIGGADLAAATNAGILKAVAAAPTTVKITGTVKDTLAGANKDAKVTVVGAKAATEYTATVAKGTTAFEVAVPVDDTYSVKVTKPSFLSYTITGVPVAQADVAVGDINISALAGDVDGSGQVTFNDLSALLDDYMESTANLANVNSDIDGSGQVVFNDLSNLLDTYMDLAPVVEYQVAN